MYVCVCVFVCYLAGHLAFLVPDVAAKREQLEKAGYTFEESPDEVTVPGTVVVYDPDRCEGLWGAMK